MCRPVELYPAGYPWPQKTDKCRFYHVLTVKKIPSGRLVLRAEHPTSVFRQNRHADVVILYHDSAQFPPLRFIRSPDVSCHRVRVRIAAHPLMNAVLGEDRQFLRHADRIYRDTDCNVFYTDFVHLCVFSFRIFCFYIDYSTFSPGLTSKNNRGQIFFLKYT